MNNELESILSYYYYGPIDVWDDYVKAVEEWARNERAEAWDEGFNASENNIEDTPNPYRPESD